MPAGPEAILAADGLAVRFPGAAADAVRDVSFALARGELLAVLGPSGSGKSTLALAVLGAIPHLVPADRRGTVAVRGRPLLPGLLSGAAAVLQDTDAQIVALSVEDELAFALENLGAPPAEIEAAIARALGRAPALGLGRRDRTLTLSGGWRQRLSLAAALAATPDLLVVDEPVAHLDGPAADEALAALAALRGEDCATLLVEHRADRVAALADRALVLGPDGAPVALASPMEALRIAAARPAGLGLRLPAALVAEAAEAMGPDTNAVVSAFGFSRLGAAPDARGAVLLDVAAAAVRRGGRDVLDGIDLRVHAGEVVGLTGPNGAGKTTLAYLACGALRARAGHVHRPAAPAPSYVPQNPALAFTTGSLAAEAARRGLGWSDLAVRLDRARLPVDPARHPLALSHGEKRRLALALELAAARPRLVVLDEPAAGLDGFGLRALYRDIAELRARGAGVVVIAHDLDLLAAVCDRICVLDRGRVAAAGTAAEVVAGALAGRLPVCPGDRLAYLARRGWRPAA